MNFVFIDKTNQGDDRQVGMVDLGLVAGAEMDWGNGYIVVHMLDTPETLKMHFRSENHMKHEFLRFVTRIDEYREAMAKEIAVSFVRH